LALGGSLVIEVLNAAMVGDFLALCLYLKKNLEWTRVPVFYEYYYNYKHVIERTLRRVREIVMDTVSAMFCHASNGASQVRRLKRRAEGDLD